ncbi:Arsenical resistance operon trans-acting repressor ArsD [Anatilimnocola aggregata]|uniref:Arsenical resistance operon trans-acting repressor ArsD n=1 Tax=Anatilimnocola aggregata TaxID=2528021 RepID=A0A517YCU4_9BACT|nr:arsenite efflux transporter metallochaperone ArsD [Anatilimnocola aggregata]QDU28067.1 Arsenical resistance operon trans-acting repressor ArsD [Anatilimnocola aggregata]
MTFQVFDKPMCCSTGVCGTQVDQTLVRFAADLDWLRRNGVQVERYSLSQQPSEFAQKADVRTALQTKGTNALPIIRVDGKIVCQGMYPSRNLLASWGHVALQDEAPASTV